MDDEVTSDGREGIHIFPEDIGEFCTIADEDDVQFIEQIPGSGQFSELIVIKDDDFHSFEEEYTIECDPIGLNPIDATSVSCSPVKSENNVSDTETSEDHIPAPVDPVKIRHKLPPISDKVVQKGVRRRCSDEQWAALEKMFKQTSYPDYSTKKDLAGRLGLTYRYVCKWFSRRRETINRQTSRCSKKANLGSFKQVDSFVQSSPGTYMEEDLANVLKSRHRFSKDQLVILEGAFKRNRYPDPVILEDITVRFGLTNVRTVKQWFAHRRTKTNTVDKRPKILKEACCSKPELPALRPGAEGAGDISPQKEGSSFSTRVGGLQRANRKSMVSGSQAVLCKICDRRRKRMRNSCCEACHSFMKRYRLLSQSRRRLSVPPCSHKGTRVLAGCKGCRVFRYQQEASKQKETSQLNRSSVKTNPRSIRKNTPVSQDINERRRSDRILASSKHYQNSCDDKKTNENGASGAGISELESTPSTREYPVDLQKKIHVTGKLNKLRKIAKTLSNPDHMETKDRITLSGEINSCVDDLLSLVFDIVSTPRTKENASSTGKSGPAKPLLPCSSSETSCPSLEMKIQSLEGMVKESMTLIRGLEGHVRNSSRKETFTQTEAYLVFVRESSERDKPLSLPDELESNPILQPSATPQNYPSMPTTYCQICEQTRPYATVNHLLICQFCINFVENRKMLSRPNRNLLLPRCPHRGTQAKFGCADCLLFRYNRVNAGLMPNITSFGLKSSQPVGSQVRNKGCHAPSPINPAGMNFETHQSTSAISSQLIPNLTSSYSPQIQSSPNTSQAGNNQPGMSTLTQLLTLPQNDTTPEVNPYQRIPNAEMPITPLRRKNMKCPSVYGRNYECLWCEGCRCRKGCTRY